MREPRFPSGSSSTGLFLGGEGRYPLAVVLCPFARGQPPTSHVLSGGNPAPLDVDHLAVDIAGTVRRQEEHGFRDLARVSETLHRVHRFRLVDLLRGDTPLLLPVPGD